jgi:hypothetical protein
LYQDSVAALKNVVTKNGLVNGSVQMVGRSIENKVDDFMIIAGFSPLSLVPAEIEYHTSIHPAIQPAASRKTSSLARI